MIRIIWLYKCRIQIVEVTFFAQFIINNVKKKLWSLVCPIELGMWSLTCTSCYCIFTIFQNLSLLIVSQSQRSESLGTLKELSDPRNSFCSVPIIFSSYAILLQISKSSFSGQKNSTSQLVSKRRIETALATSVHGKMRPTFILSEIKISDNVIIS